MEWFKNVESILNSDLAKSYLVKKEAAPAPYPAAAPVVNIAAPEGMSQKSIFLIVGGVVAVIVAIVLVKRK